MRAPSTLAVLATVGFTAPGQEPPEGKPVFPAETELVTVDAVVIDREGVPVTGLRASDFSLSEDGVRQEIVAFEAVDRPVPAEAPARLPRSPRRLPPVSSNRAAPARVDPRVRGRVRRPAPRRRPRRCGPARRWRPSSEHGRRGPGDLVATGGTSWWHARMPEGREGLLEIAARLVGRARTGESPTEPMSDYEAMSIARNGDPLVLGHVVRRWSAAATDFSRCDVASAGGTGIKAAADRIFLDVSAGTRRPSTSSSAPSPPWPSVRGRKSVLLVSGGLVHDPHLAGFRRTVTESRRANAAIYFVDARGLVALGSDFTAEARAPTDLQDMSLALGETNAGSEGSESLAADTGGFSVKNRNDLATA